MASESFSKVPASTSCRSEPVVLLGAAVAPMNRVGLGQLRCVFDPGEQSLVSGRSAGGLRHRTNRNNAPRLSAMRAVLRFVGAVMMVSGVLLLGDAGATLLWQEPVSAYVAERQQGKLEEAFVAAPPRVIRKQPLPGDAIARLTIPAIGSQRIRRGGHRHREPAQGARPLPRHPVARRARDVRDRGPPHDLRRALSEHR